MRSFTSQPRNRPSERQLLRSPGNAADAQRCRSTTSTSTCHRITAEGTVLREADVALQKALKLDPTNPFTLNNLGYAREKEGELEEAYKFYIQAADQHSTTIVVTVHPSWRGKGISEIAARNADKVKSLMEREQDTTAQVARFNTRGVAAINRNDYKLARQYFEQAYKLDQRMPSLSTTWAT